MAREVRGPLSHWSPVTGHHTRCLHRMDQDRLKYGRGTPSHCVVREGTDRVSVKERGRAAQRRSHSQSVWQWDKHLVGFTRWLTLCMRVRGAVTEEAQSGRRGTPSSGMCLICQSESAAVDTVLSRRLYPLSLSLSRCAGRRAKRAAEAMAAAHATQRHEDRRRECLFVSTLTAAAAAGDCKSERRC